MADERKSQASRAASKVATERNSTTLYDQGQDEGQGSGSGQIPDAGPAQYQSQKGGKIGKRCMCNPMKCCCKGNLRRASFAVSIFELYCGCQGVTAIILLSVVVSVSKASRSALVSSSISTNSSSSSSSSLGIATVLDDTFTVVAIVSSFGTLFILAAGISLLLATLKKFKIACLIHTGFSSLLSAYQCSWFIAGAIIINMISTSCSGGKEINIGPLKNACSLGAYYTLMLVLTMISSLAWAVVYTYFAVTSTALYCHYKNGETYEGTKFCPCGGGKGSQVNPQPQYKNPNQNPNQHEDKQQSPTPSEQDQPPPEYTSQVDLNPKLKSTTNAKAKSKSRASSNVNTSTKKPHTKQTVRKNSQI